MSNFTTQLLEWEKQNHSKEILSSQLNPMLARDSRPSALGPSHILIAGAIKSSSHKTGQAHQQVSSCIYIYILSALIGKVLLNAQSVEVLYPGPRSGRSTSPDSGL